MTDKTKNTVILDGWRSFESRVVNPAAGEHQRNEMRMAFFSGAMILFSALMNRMTEGAEVEADDEQLLTDIHDELREYGDGIVRKAGN